MTSQRAPWWARLALIVLGVGLALAAMDSFGKVSARGDRAVVGATVLLAAWAWWRDEAR